jgi:glycosyltransferase involved in cell wall biosynthesis
MRQIEPLLPDSVILPTLTEYITPFGSRLGKAYFKLADSIEAPFSHLFVLPWLQRGEADLVAVNYIKLVAERFGPQAPLVVLTLDSHNPGLEWIPEGIRVIKLHDFGAKLTGHDIVEILTRLILQARPSLVHNINSEACWRVFKSYHRQIAKTSKLVASLFSFVNDVDGAIAGPSAKYLNCCIDNLDLLLCDNKSFVADIKRRYALEEDILKRVFVAYFPSTVSPGFHSSRVSLEASRRNILWADKVASGKSLTILAAIARRLPDCCFRVWGSPCYGDDDIEELGRVPNVDLCGPFLQFEEVLATDSVVFVYTSETTGLPNILLEAMAAGLAVIAPNVGAVRELITNSTGWLIEDFFDVDSYERAIIEATENEVERSKRLKAARELLQQRHTWSAFAQTVEASGYWTS